MGVRDGGGCRSRLALHRKDTFPMSVEITASFSGHAHYCLLKSTRFIGDHIYIYTERVFEASHHRWHQKSLVGLLPSKKPVFPLALSYMRQCGAFLRPPAKLCARMSCTFMACWWVKHISNSNYMRISKLLG